MGEGGDGGWERVSDEEEAEAEGLLGGGERVLGAREGEREEGGLGRVVGAGGRSRDECSGMVFVGVKF